MDFAAKSCQIVLVEVNFLHSSFHPVFFHVAPMSFRKRNVGLSGSARSDASLQAASKAHIQLAGVRPSPIDGRPTTSTGTASLDALLAGHSGLPLGCSILIEENGTTDYAGALLRFYAAEGISQSHHIHVIGLPEQWGRELPGVVGEPEKKDTPAETEKMKIAWRYESLGQFGASTSSRGGHTHPCSIARPSIPLHLTHTIETNSFPLYRRTTAASDNLKWDYSRAGTTHGVLSYV